MGIKKMTVLKDGMTLEGRRFELLKTDFDDDRPEGMGQYGYAVSVLAGGDSGPMAVGFSSRAHAEAYITQYGDKEFTVYDSHGRKGNVVRACLGVPPGMIRNRETVTMEVEPHAVVELPERDADPQDRGRNTPGGPTAQPEGGQGVQG